MAYRFRVFDGPPTGGGRPPGGSPFGFQFSAPTAGGEVHMALETGGTPAFRWRPWPGKGTPFVVEAGATISAGDDLETDAQGRAVPQSSGTTVARALEGAISGEDFWAVWT